MGQSPSLSDLKKKDQELADYIDSVEQRLAAKLADMQKQIADEVTKFESSGHISDARILVSGYNTDFIHNSEFSMANVKNIIDQISKVVFAGSKAGPVPDGAKVDADAQEKLEQSLGAAVTDMAAVELYIAGQVFDVLGNIVMSLGASTGVTLDTSFDNKPLGMGLQLFAGVFEQTYQDQSFFKNEYVYEYLYVYEVHVSVQQLAQETDYNLLKNLANRLDALSDALNQMSEKLPDPSDDTATKKWQTMNDWYQEQYDKVTVAYDQLKAKLNVKE